MGNPVGAARHIRQALAADGTWLIVEPLAGDTLADNLNPVGRVYYSFSTFLCVPNSRSQPGGYALGAQAGEQAIRQVAELAGLHPLPPGDRNAVQRRLRGSSLTAHDARKPPTPITQRRKSHDQEDHRLPRVP